MQKPVSAKPVARSRQVQNRSREAGVMGTPFLRFSDFVGRLDYLRELEERYRLGYGVTPDRPGELLDRSAQLAANPAPDTYRERRQRILSEKCNTSDFFHQYILDFQQKNHGIKQVSFSEKR